MLLEPGILQPDLVLKLVDVALALAENIRSRGDVEERGGAGLAGHGANGDEEVGMARIGRRWLQVQIRGLGSGGRNRLEAETANVVLEVESNRWENRAERFP